MSAKRVFVSYCSKQGEWVWDRLVPCLKAGGAEVLIDRERFKAGKSVIGQMDATQDKANRHVLVLSPDYLKSPHCTHEMNRAIAFDPQFQKHIVLPTLRETCTLPPKIAKPNPLYVDLRDDKAAPQWTKLMDACSADLGTDTPAWLNARDEVRRLLRRKESVNLVVSRKVNWRGLVDNVHSEDDPKGAVGPLATVDMQAGACASRRGLVEQIIRVLGGTTPVPQEPEDLVTLNAFISGLPKKPCLALLHFDYVSHRADYDVNLWGALRDLVTEKKKLYLLIQSLASVQTLLPKDHPMSSGFTSLQTVELKGRS